MKSIEELKKLRDKAQEQMGIRKDGEDKMRVAVGMATCGIAAGARPVLTTFMEEIATRKLKDVAVTQTGCIGVCQFEPVVEITDDKHGKVTYVKVTPEMVKRIVADHVVNGNVVEEYTIGDHIK